MAVFSRTSNLFGLLTSDDPFQYLGGISLAVRNIDGKSPQLYISNLRDANNSRTETIQKFMAKELRNRAFHPRWVKTMQEEGYSGALAMLDNVNNFWGWQVTAPESVREDQWQSFFDVYIEDKYELDMDKWMTEANNHTKAQMLERMLEAVRKDYWKADPETLKKMVSEYVKQVEQFDYSTDNEKFVEYIKNSAQGYGLDTSAITIPPPAGTIKPSSAPQASQVEGVKLEKSKPNQESEVNYNWMLIITLLFMLLVLLAGLSHRLIRHK